VYVADQAQNISADSEVAVLNYIKPGNFIFSGESHLFVFPLLGGEHFSAHLTNEYTDNDADLYFWPPDYPVTPYWASATAGSGAETLNVTIPADGWYWLEVYGYDFSYYDLTLGLSTFADEKIVESMPGMPDGIRPRSTPLAVAESQPSLKAIVPGVPRKVFLPLVRR
jgi:hypothetical protein